MLVQNLIDQINLEADELLDTDNDTIQYINAAIDYLAFALAGLQSSDSMETVQIANGLPVPSNFVEFVPKNGYPVYIRNNIFYIANNSSNVLVKYSVSKPHVSTIGDTIPFNDMYGSVLTFIASYMIKKKSYIPVEYTSQDSSFVQSVMALISKAKGGA